MKRDINMNEEHPIDKLFREGLKEPAIPFDEKDWQALAGKLHPDDTRGPAFPFWILAGIGFLLLLGTAVFWMGNDEQGFSDEQVEIIDNRSTIADGASAPDAQTEKPEHLLSGTPLSDREDKAHEKNVPPRKEGKVKTLASSRATPQGKNFVVNTAPENPGFQEYGTGPHPAAASAVGTSGVPAAQTLNPLAPLIQNIRPLEMNLKNPVIRFETAGSPVDSEMYPLRRRWSVSLVTAPDLTGDQALRGQLSGNVGITATFHTSGRFSFTTGVFYARKNYNTPFSKYKPDEDWYGYGSDPDRVSADCRVLDIPLIANFVFRKENRGAWIASGGLSSYFMLKEKYEFQYEKTTRYPRHYTFRKENRHLLSVLHLGLGYQWRLNSSLSVTMQPFLKVPVSRIGQGNIRLYSTGLALSADLFPGK